MLIGPYDNKDLNLKRKKIKLDFLGARGAFKTDYTTCIYFWSPPPPKKSYTQKMLIEVFAHSNSTSINR